ncbi:ATPase, T2SS/T4P/T4SS family [Paenibacillus sp. DMB20]|uniref:ATPase, T2SS/T4P/T4SS family n=1 Tax=Paenibacillus sp. DMB20 TaxID=1642570 RepID=UPI000627B512|nr:ATPase, T2SS/T4P/T4SS family [Paenibacillus sp. DMB20]KKO55515.1 pilus assembly protein CpaF [Paenibacillus sp. DMB20]
MLTGTFQNTLFMVLIFILAGLYITLRWRRTKRQLTLPRPGPDQYSLESMTAFVKDTLHQITRSQLSDLGLHEEEYRRRLSKRSELRRALKGCISGNVLDKRYVKDFLKELLLKNLQVNESNLNHAIPFHRHEALTPQDKFEILLYLYQQEYGDEALSTMLELYHLSQPRILEEYGEDAVYAVTADDIDYIYDHEIRPLSLEDKLNIVVQRIYQHYKGFSVIDEIRDQRIDGVSGGVSGMLGDKAVEDTLKENDYYAGFAGPPASECESIWIFYKGISIHMAFLSFGDVRELKRVCQNIYKYNHPGQLSEANGYKVNEMKDGSRVVVVRPPFSESWAFFVRKFDVDAVLLDQLITGHGAHIPIGLLQYLMKGSRITAITGAQGSGKTTLLMAMVKHIYASYTLRVQEMAFELHLRKIYSRRNILSFRETEFISGQEGLDLQKKTDGTVNILGEVASDEVASWMIQMSQVASLFTVFTHHAKTFNDLVQSLRNSLLKSGMFRQEDIAEQQVVSVINFDIHLRRDHNGKRYIERITECIPFEWELSGEAMPEEAETLAEFGQSHTKHSADGSRQSVRYRYTSRNVVEYRNGGYEATAPLSRRSIREMEEQMLPQDIDSFRNFIRESWGVTV